MRAVLEELGADGDEDAHGWSAGSSRRVPRPSRGWCLAADDGETRGQSGLADTGKRAQLGNDLLVEQRQPSRIRVPRRGRQSIWNTNAFCESTPMSMRAVATRLRTTRIATTVNDSASATCETTSAARPRRTSRVAARLPGAGFEQLVDVGARQLYRGKEAERDGRDERDGA